MSHVKLQLEQFGETPAVNPELRYAQIHRDLEKGLNSERLWIELVEVCLELGKVGEAAKSLAHVYTPQEAVRLTRAFEERGIVFHGASGAPGLLGDVSGVDPQSLGPAEKKKKPLHASVAPPVPKSTAPPGGRAVSGSRRQELERESVLEQFQDALGYLFVDHMPLAAIGFTLLFPALGSVFFLLPTTLGMFVRSAITALPALLCLGLVLHAARRVLEASAEGEEDPPALLDRVMARAPKAVLGFLILTGVCFLPAVALSLAKAPFYPVMVLFVLGSSYYPMALLGAVMNRTLGGAAPRRVLRAISVAPAEYVQVVGIFLAAFVLPTYVILSFLGKSVFLQAAVTGPLLVGPSLVLGRMLGRFWYVRSERLAGIFGVTLSVQNFKTLRENARTALRSRSGVAAGMGQAQVAPPVRAVGQGLARARLPGRTGAAAQGGAAVAGRAQPRAGMPAPQPQRGAARGPEAPPQRGAARGPQPSPQRSGQRAPQPSPQRAAQRGPQPSPQRGPHPSPQRAAQRAPQPSPQRAAQRAPQPSPQRAAAPKSPAWRAQRSSGPARELNEHRHTPLRRRR